jgi:hypothetical protein
MANRQSQLPEDRPAVATWAQVRYAWLLAILFVALLNVWATRAGKRLLARMPGGIAAKWAETERRGRAAQWVVLGDSAGGAGVDPVALGTQLGGSCLNLALPSGQPLLGAWMLDSYIQHHGAPRGVVVVHVYDIWPRGVTVQTISRVPLPWGFWDTIRPPVRLTLGERLEMVMSRRFMLYAERNLWRRQLTNAPAILKQLVRPATPAPAQQQPTLSQTLGFTPMRRQSFSDLAWDLASHQANLRRPQFAFRVSPVNRAGVQHMLELARQHDFQIYFAPAPIDERIAAEPGFQRWQRDLFRTLTELTAGEPRAHVLSELPNVFPERDLANTVDHLLEPAAQRYTRQLADAVQRQEPTRAPR